MSSSNQFSEKIAIIIPTRNRPEILKKLLTSIRIQSVQPDLVLIVDGSDQSIEPEIQEYLNTTTRYVYCYPPSLTKQKNAGLKHLTPEISLVGYLDDDIELEPDAIMNLLSYWENHSRNLGGSSFNIINVPSKKTLVTLIRRFFTIDGKLPGKVLGSGFCTPLFPSEVDIDCEWLCGGATVWRRSLFDSYHFDEYFAGWAYHEDADFSYPVSKKYKLVLISSAKVTHNPPPFNPKNLKHLGMMAIINRYYFVSKNKDLSVPLFYWASLGEILVNVLQSAYYLNMGGIQTARGNLIGISHIVRGDLVQFDKNFRK
ncbi:glycosyltransferase family 2 protein [Methanoregula formicica]|uniref:Putative glycosyltransferase n=1 Tax=Methanoregula formicica (strain DSM 22288 / NBRC 105244 / SMSP) TaxID=593750 RepID=L0HEY2_METFS|nr:glycosyltransferase [Methanoregula formicica]AGB02341.1 putative glycosyltransferase [Methanoregula formicica SMSP]